MNKPNLRNCLQAQYFRNVQFIATDRLSQVSHPNSKLQPATRDKTDMPHYPSFKTPIIYLNIHRTRCPSNQTNASHHNRPRNSHCHPNHHQGNPNLFPPHIIKRTPIRRNSRAHRSMISAMDILMTESATPLTSAPRPSPKHHSIFFFCPFPDNRRAPKDSSNRVEKNEKRAGRTNTQDQ